MKRLTIRTDICAEPENDIIYSNPNDPEGMYNILDLAECLYNGGEVESSILLEISNRLAEYEDTGLSPAEVAELAQAKAEGCVWCKENGMVTHNGQHYELFCSYCGRRLEVEGKEGGGVKNE